MKATPRANITTEQILRLLFKRDTANIKSDYEGVGWFNDMIAKMKGSFEVEESEYKGVKVYESHGKINCRFIATEFEELYEVK